MIISDDPLKTRTVYSVAEALEHADERNPPNAKTQAAIAFQLSRIADALEILAKEPNCIFNTLGIT